MIGLFESHVVSYWWFESYVCLRVVLFLMGTKGIIKVVDGSDGLRVVLFLMGAKDQILKFYIDILWGAC